MWLLVSFSLSGDSGPVVEWAIEELFTLSPDEGETVVGYVPQVVSKLPHVVLQQAVAIALVERPEADEGQNQYHGLDHESISVTER